MRAKGTAALLVLVASFLSTFASSWQTVFIVASALNLIAAFSALLRLKAPAPGHDKIAAGIPAEPDALAAAA